MKKVLMLALGLVLGLAVSAQAQTFSHNLSWTVDNPGSPEPATEYRVEEQDSAGAWATLATVPATQTTFADTGNASGQLSTYRVVPMKDGLDGTPSNTVICGSVPPDTQISLTCSSSPE